MRLFWAVWVVVLAGCIVEPDVEGRRPMVDVPAVYLSYWEAVDACYAEVGWPLEKGQSFERIEWYVADHIEHNYSGTQMGHRITIEDRARGAEWVVRHELSHYRSAVGNALHIGPEKRVPCDSDSWVW